MWQDDTEKALPYIIRQIRLSRKNAGANADAFVSAARCYRAKGDYRRAIKAAQFAIKLNEQNAGAYWEMGIIMSAMRQFSQAVIDYTKALKFLCSQKLDGSGELLEQLSYSVEQSSAFKKCRRDCFYASMGAISYDELVERLDSAISEFKKSGE